MFYEVVNIWGVLYASIDPKDNRLYSQKELPMNASIIREKAPIVLIGNKK